VPALRAALRVVVLNSAIVSFDSSLTV
jgi:hypothetical protein